MSIKDTLGSPSYERLRLVARATSPEEEVSDDVVDAMVLEMWRDYQNSYRELGVPPPPATPHAPRTFPRSMSPHPAAVPMYLANARHMRSETAPHTFVGHLPLVRVPLASAGAAPIFTPIGDVLREHHLMFNLDDVAHGFAGRLGYRPARVELVTPPATGGRRFAAISFYLGYRGLEDATPSFYILEAGLAGGGPRRLFFGSAPGVTIDEKGDYQPTPFSLVTNYYRGRLDLDGDEPKHLSVLVSHEKGGDSHLDISVAIKRLDAPPEYAPAKLYVESVFRVAAIARAMNRSIPGVNSLELKLAAFAGKALYRWDAGP